MRLAPVFAALLLAGCAEVGPPPTAPTATIPTALEPGWEGEPVAFRTLLHAVDVPLIEHPQSSLLHPASWNETWDRYASMVSPRPAKPHVDHENESVFLVAMGEVEIACADIRIANITVRPDKVYVWAESFTGGPLHLCARETRWPVHVVAAPARTDTPHFITAPVPEPFEWPPAPDAGVPERLIARPLAKGEFSKIHEDTRVLLRDAAAWESMWEQHRPGTPAPPVDFSNESVVAVVVHGPTGCSGVHLGAITYDASARIVDVPIVFERSDPDIRCLVAYEDLFEFVAIADRPGEARFRDVAWHEESAPVGEYAFRTLAKGTDTSLNVSERRTITDESRWREFWDAHTARMASPPERPEVDFEKERVLAVIRGWRRDECWDVEVLRIEVGESYVTVRIRDDPPPEGEVCDLEVRRPFHFVTYPITPKAPLYLEGPDRG